MWFQLYGLPRDGHRDTFDLISCARDCKVGALVLALDAPVRSVRPHDLRNGLTVPFRPTPRTGWQFATSPAWAREAVRTGLPLFASVARYVGPDPSLADVAGFVQRELRGSFT